MEAAVVSWPDENLLDVEEDIRYLAQNIQGQELLTVGVGIVEFQIRRDADIKAIRYAQLRELRRRVGLDRRSGTTDRRSWIRDDGSGRRQDDTRV
jgi:hypothetical protein